MDHRARQEAAVPEIPDHPAAPVQDKLEAQRYTLLKQEIRFQALLHGMASLFQPEKLEQPKFRLNLGWAKTEH
jgi:hypothetical protein